jgi:hypothetical protein
MITDKNEVILSGKGLSRAYLLEVVTERSNQTVNVTRPMYVSVEVNNCISFVAYQPFTEVTLTATKIANVDPSNCRSDK